MTDDELKAMEARWREVVGTSTYHERSMLAGDAIMDIFKLIIEIRRRDDEWHRRIDPEHGTYTTKAADDQRGTYTVNDGLGSGDRKRMSEEQNDGLA